MNSPALDLFADPDDPFGSVLPDGLENMKFEKKGSSHSRRSPGRSLDSQAMDIAGGKDPERTGKEGRRQTVNHTPRTRAYYESLGYNVANVESHKVNAYGGIFKVDFYGLFDLLCIKLDGNGNALPCAPILLVQICGVSMAGTHLTGMMSSQETSFNKTPKVKNLKMLMECGHFRMVLAVWSQAAGIGSRWSLEEREITHEELMKALSRKRKPLS